MEKKSNKSKANELFVIATFIILLLIASIPLFLYKQGLTGYTVLGTTAGATTYAFSGILLLILSVFTLFRLKK